MGNGPSGIAFGDGSVWVTNGLSGTVSRISPGTNRVVETIDVGNGPAGILYASGSIWVANTGDDTITRIDPESGRPAKTLSVGATELAFGAGTLWASQRTANRVARIDPETGDVQSIEVGNGPTGIAFGSRSAWVTNSLDGTLARIDPETSSVADVIPVGNGPTAVAADSSGVWVSNAYDGTVVRVDPRTSRVAGRLDIGNRPQGIGVSEGEALVSIGESDAAHRGGALIVRNPAIVESIDTALADSTTEWMLLRMTNDGLVAFNETSGLAGAQLVPDLALSFRHRRTMGRHTSSICDRASATRPGERSGRRTSAPPLSATSKPVVLHTLAASSARPAAWNAPGAAISPTGSSRTTQRGR